MRRLALRRSRSSFITHEANQSFVSGSYVSFVVSSDVDFLPRMYNLNGSAMDYEVLSPLPTHGRKSSTVPPNRRSIFASTSPLR